ncbi:MAG: amidohydrolase family protein [Acidobacteria bacterium]|nr:amidohydrolase family protein [Acidobacteriota bacterium]
MALTGMAQVVVIEHVNVIPMTSNVVLKDQTVLVQDGRYAAIGGKVKVPAGAVRVDGKGKFLMPEFAEMHGHIPPPTASREQTEDVLFLSVANGVTTVRGMLGYEGRLELREKSKRNEIVVPALYLAGPSFSGATVKSVAQAVERVKQQKTEGWHLLKIHPGVPRDAYDAMAATAQSLGIRFSGHVPAAVGILHALELRQETIDHLDGYIEYLDKQGEPIADAWMVEMASRTKAAGAAVVPTMALWETIIGAKDAAEVNAYPELQYMPRAMVTQWREAFQGRQSMFTFSREKVDRVARDLKRLLKVFSEQGVKILFGTDAPQQYSVPGFSIHREMKVMAEAGMKPYDILRFGTASVGDYFKTKDAFGMIATGQRGAAVLLDANPLEAVANMRKVSGVLLRGKWISSAEIAKRLEAIAARYAR